jgi:hypothetical protein
MLIVILMALVLAFLFACGYVVAYSGNQLYSRFFVGVTLLALAVTVAHVVIADMMGWNVLWPANGKAQFLLTFYVMGVFLWAGVLSYLVMRKFPALAKRIFYSVAK